nr:ribonuclease H-like domain-containing protein [Tanacetum cinerariifolium]GFA30458.1 ribonuclease H-like domain-containing protein [Tanacetum cinerariifolium]
SATRVGFYHSRCDSSLFILRQGSQMRIGQAASQEGGLLQVTVFFGDNLLFRSSKCQQTITRSSVEAEYRGVANVVAETAWLRNLLRELHSLLSAATLVYCDNVSATYLTINEDERLARAINRLCDGLTTAIEEKEKYILPPSQRRW